ncbi:NUDIX domain-containing protein [Candidatus Saccharibacteria bacterium]|nr:NUDIX domain-containing protein [Candidatus Saccharibacteria bacterium]
MRAERFRINFASYLVLREENRVLLSKRENTGWKDGWYSLVAGHVEAGETSELAIIREAKEEAGVDIKLEDLTHVYTMHRQADNPQDDYIDIFFECKKWQGEIVNAEPHKCGGLEWFDIDELPDDVLRYIKKVIQNYPQHKTYSSESRE